MTDFFRFPQTPHIGWLGDSLPRDDKLMSPDDIDLLLSGEVVIEEKIDGANIGVSFDPDGTLRVQNRGQYLETPYSGQFSRLTSWLGQFRQGLLQVMNRDLILFGEWCAAIHSIEYLELPDWFLLFDVYDRTAAGFWSVQRRNTLAMEAGLAVVPELLRGEIDQAGLTDLLTGHKSRYTDGPLEGIVVRNDDGDWCKLRGKLVRREFVQAIDDHWKSAGIRWNRVRYDAES